MTLNREEMGYDSPSSNNASQGVVDENAPLLGASSSSTTLYSSTSNTTSQTIPATGAAIGTLPSDSQPLLRDGGENGDVGQGGNPKVGRSDISRTRGACIMFCIWVLIFLQAMNMSGMTMAQSTIAIDLNSYDSAMWFTSSYLIAMSSLAPVAGRLAGDVFSPRAMVIGSSVFFSLGGIIVAAANSFATLVAGRVVTGIGAAGIMSLAIILVIDLTSDQRKGLFVGLVNIGFTIGLSMGAVVFGAAVPVWGWRFLFGVQSPVALLAGLGVFFSIPSGLKAKHSPSNDLSTLQKLAKLDYLGAITMIATIVLILTSLSGISVSYPLLILSLGFFIAFLTTELYLSPDPLIPRTLLLHPGTILSCIAQLFFMSARWTILFYTPIFCLAVLGLSPATSGSILIPTNFGFGTGGLLVGLFHIRKKGSFLVSSLVSLSLFGATLLLVAISTALSVTRWLYVLLVFLNGLSTGAAINYTLHHLLHITPPGSHFLATSLLGTFRGFSGSFGSAIGGGVFARKLKGALLEGFSRLAEGDRARDDEDYRQALASKLVGSPAMVYQDEVLTEAEREVAVAGYVAALRTLFFCAVGLSVLVVIVQAFTGSTGAIEDEDEDEDEIRAAMEGRGVEGD